MKTRILQGTLPACWYAWCWPTAHLSTPPPLHLSCSSSWSSRIRKSSWTIVHLQVIVASLWIQLQKAADKWQQKEAKVFSYLRGFLVVLILHITLALTKDKSTSSGEAASKEKGWFDWSEGARLCWLYCRFGTDSCVYELSAVLMPCCFVSNECFDVLCLTMDSPAGCGYVPAHVWSSILLPSFSRYWLCLFVATNRCFEKYFARLETGLGKKGSRGCFSFVLTMLKTVCAKDDIQVNRCSWTVGTLLEMAQTDQKSSTQRVWFPKYHAK